MQYVSTRDKSLNYTAAHAIEQGLSRDGGLFLPERMPVLPDLGKLVPMSYQERAVAIMKLFLEGFSEEELMEYASKAYGPDKFDCREVAPVVALDENTNILELWHGPTCAFKDMALQMLPYLLTASMKKNGEDKTVCILVATSGDTGKAALEGFCDVDHTKILVFYPKDGVSDIQKLQMVTQRGKNVGVCAVVGNFDDAQSGVKKIFSDVEYREELLKKGYVLSSANSINWGRVLPQIVYYISAYCDLLAKKTISAGDLVNFCVPTGNFGNILACYYAKKMGLPVGKLICASNANNVLTDFICTGTYDRNRTFYTTNSPSMDILISSNLERLLFDLTGSDDEVRSYMQKLSEDGKYDVDAAVLDKIKENFVAGCCDDVRTLETIKKVYDDSGYLMDTHTAVAYAVLSDYQKASGDKTASVVVSTASPFKFCDSVLSALGINEQRPGTEVLQQLTEASGMNAPKPLAELAGKEVRFTKITQKDQMTQVVSEVLN